ncbi:MAG TPA: CHAT domain-containing protein [Gemmatimonadaceae bacterium]|nr:CHAT domain-containing protein [Gemmatimonadaceae bacterium]
MRLLGWLACTAAILACQPEPSKKPQNNFRSDATTLTLPQDPGALAAVLGVPADSLMGAGQERYQNQTFDSARAIWNVELTRTLAKQDKKAEARVRMWLGLVAWKLSDYKTARREGEASVALKRSLGMDDELSRSFNALGLTAWHEGRHTDALVMYDSAIAAAKRNNDILGIARASANIPLVKIELGRFDEARRDFDRAIQVNREAKDDRTQEHLLSNMGMLEIRLGNPSKGIELLNRARAQLSDDDVSEQANILGQLATAWGSTGDLQRAIAAADSAFTIARADGLQQEAASNLEVLADLEVQAGDNRLALATLHTADSIDAEVGLRNERGTNLRRAAMILLDLGDVEPSMQMARRALAEHRAVDALTEQVLDRLQLAAALTRAGQSAIASAQIDSAERDARSSGNPSIVNEAAIAFATLAIATGKPQAAVNKLSPLEKTGSINDWRISDLQSTAFLALGRNKDARNSAMQAVALVERERASLGVGPLRAGYLANRTRPFSHRIAAELALGDTTAAFETAAALPGRSLAERFSGIDDPGARFALIARSEKVLLRANEVEREIAQAHEDGASSGQLSALDVELTRMRTAYERTVGEQAKLPRVGVLGGSLPALREIQGRLSPRQALLLYVSGEDRLELFVVRSGAVAHRSVRVNERELSRKIRFARDALQRQSQSSAPPAILGELHDILIAPFEKNLAGVSELIIIPHGSLGALPFAALWNRRSGKFLVEQKVIINMPTVAAITIGSQARELKGRTLDVFAPTPEELPATRREAETLGRLVRNSMVQIGRRSTKAGVRAALARGDIVHLASHGQHNSQNPLFSHVTVGSGSRAGFPASVMTVQDIMTSPTRSPLVFLSGCETGLNAGGSDAVPFRSEEGSLSQAFLFAGASNVVATLWAVRDQDAANIAGDFYKSLTQGSSPWDALADAQRRSIHRRGSLMWAAYTVSSIGAAKGN